MAAAQWLVPTPACSRKNPASTESAYCYIGTPFVFFKHSCIIIRKAWNFYHNFQQLVTTNSYGKLNPQVMFVTVRKSVSNRSL